MGSEETKHGPNLPTYTKNHRITETGKKEKFMRVVLSLSSEK